MELLVNTNPGIEHKVFWRGESVDADAMPIVTVYDVTLDPLTVPPIPVNSVLYTLTAEKVETDIGVYQVFLPLEATSKSRDLKLSWSYSIQGQPVTKTHKLYVVTPYVDVAQAIDALGLGSDPSDPNYKTYKELLTAERYARKIIENVTTQNFYLYEDTYIVYGNGTDVLPLPQKINRLYELYVNDVLLIDNISTPAVNNWGYSTIISESSFGIRINRGDMLDNTVYVANGMIPPTINDSSGVFREKTPYKVRGRFGWEEIPDEIELACIELMRDYFSKDKTWRNKYLKSIQSFDWSFEYSSETFSGTGNSYVDKLLQPYVLTQMVIV
jgi:hypothetical protein